MAVRTADEGIAGLPWYGILPGHPTLLLFLCLLGGAPATAGAQGSGAGTPFPSDGGWDAGRAVELAQRAQYARSQIHQDTALLSYQADARGYVYFYLDRQDTRERNLIKTDQVAIDVFWRAPDLVKQRIVGWRDERSLPTNIQYHLDHLAVVHDNFGDLIRIGDGDEVRDVLHPAAPGAEAFYHFQLADSLALRLPGTPQPIRVYELHVRPRNLAGPGLIGSVFVDRGSGALVRMDFTFTPSSYVDRNLDYINISLDNGLWMERFWLPNRQAVEIRRQIPELDVPVGSVIRGSMRITNYRFNEELADRVFYGPPISVAPRAERESFPFEVDLYSELRAEGLGPGIELQEIRRQALALVRQRKLSGLPGTRLRAGAASDVVRYNRAEGLAFGLGLSRTVAGAGLAGVRGGWSFGPEHPTVSTEVRWRPGAIDVGMAGRVNGTSEFGGIPVVSGVMNTFSALIAGHDYLDPYYASGGEVWTRWQTTPRWSLGGSVQLEQQRSAAHEADFSMVSSHSFRPVPAIDAGWMRAATLDLRHHAPAEARSWWAGELTIRSGSLAPAQAAGADSDRLDFVRALADLGWGRNWDAATTSLELRARLGRAWGELPRQESFVIGGRGTLPGYVFRSYGGDRMALADLVVSTDLKRPWLRGRVLAAAGWAEAGSAGMRAARRLELSPTDGMRTSAGLGAGLFFDMLRVDAVRGFGPRGRWEVIVETRRSFWDFL